MIVTVAIPDAPPPRPPKPVGPTISEDLRRWAFSRLSLAIRVVRRRLGPGSDKRVGAMLIHYGQWLERDR